MKRPLIQWMGMAITLAACTIQPLTPTPEASPTLPPVQMAQVTFTPSASATNAPPTVVPPTPEVTAAETVATLTPTSAPPVMSGPSLALPVNPAPAVVAPPVADVAASEQYTMDWINAERAAAGVAPLARDETLMSIARTRVADMIARNYTGHTDPVTGEHIARAMMRAAGYTSNYLGENWYGTVTGPPDIVDIAMTWFMTDPPHADNILSPHFVSVGVGIGFNGRQWLLIQNFAGANP